MAQERHPGRSRRHIRRAAERDALCDHAQRHAQRAGLDPLADRGGVHAGDRIPARVGAFPGAYGVSRFAPSCRRRNQQDAGAPGRAVWRGYQRLDRTGRDDLPVRHSQIRRPDHRHGAGHHPGNCQQPESRSCRGADRSGGRAFGAQIARLAGVTRVAGTDRFHAPGRACDSLAQRRSCDHRKSAGCRDTRLLPGLLPARTRQLDYRRRFRSRPRRGWNQGTFFRLERRGRQRPGSGHHHFPVARPGSRDIQRAKGNEPDFTGLGQAAGAYAGTQGGRKKIPDPGHRPGRHQSPIAGL